MLFDWFTIAAQIVNFLVLVWLLKRFLYRPVLDAIDARESRVAAQLAAADAGKAEARKQRDELQRLKEAFDQQRTALLDQAREEARAERQRLLEEARAAADALAAQRQAALGAEAAQLNGAIGRRIQQEVLAIARQTLMDLADTSLEQRMVEVFTRRLLALETPARKVMAEALASASGNAVVRSAYELAPAQRTAIEAALGQERVSGIHIRFEVAPGLVSGIELVVDGQKLAWSIADHLLSIERSVDEVLLARSGSA